MRLLIALALALFPIVAAAGSAVNASVYAAGGSWMNLGIHIAVFQDQQNLSNPGTEEAGIDCEDCCTAKNQCIVGQTCENHPLCIGSWGNTGRILMRRAVDDAIRWGAHLAVGVGDNMDRGDAYDINDLCDSLGAELQEESLVFKQEFVDRFLAAGVAVIAPRGNHDAVQCHERDVIAPISASPYFYASARDTVNDPDWNVTQLAVLKRVGPWQICMLQVDCGLTTAEATTLRSWVGCGGGHPTLLSQHWGVWGTGTSFVCEGGSTANAGGSCGNFGINSNGSVLKNPPGGNDVGFDKPELFAIFGGHSYTADCVRTVTATWGAGHEVLLANINMQQSQRVANHPSNYPLGATPTDNAGNGYLRCSIWPLYPNSNGTRGRLQCTFWNPETRNSTLPARGFVDLEGSGSSIFRGYDAPFDWCTRFGGCP